MRESERIKEKIRRASSVINTHHPKRRQIKPNNQKINKASKQKEQTKYMTRNTTTNFPSDSEQRNSPNYLPLCPSSFSHEPQTNNAPRKPKQQAHAADILGSSLEIFTGIADRLSIRHERCASLKISFSLFRRHSFLAREQQRARETDGLKTLAGRSGPEEI